MKKKIVIIVLILAWAIPALAYLGHHRYGLWQDGVHNLCGSGFGWVPNTSTTDANPAGDPAYEEDGTSVWYQENGTSAVTEEGVAE